LHVNPLYQPLLRELGIDAEAVFEHPQILPWRSLADRENCTLDAGLPDGRRVRLHVKRYTPVRGDSPAELEAAGIQHLERVGIPTVPLVAWGKLADGRSFIILDDLAGFTPADKAIEAGLPFERILEPTAQLAARLHTAGLHHRDLYLCHFFVRVPQGGEAPAELRLIDAARVRPLPRWFWRNRWLVKDLAQFWHSAAKLGISEELRLQWLTRYSMARGLPAAEPLRGPVVRKAAWIERHDVRLRQRQPGRNVSIPNA
jgi:hypothetical protein